MGDTPNIDQAELAALADGSLAGPRRDALLHRLSGSPATTRALEQQRAALTAIHSTAGERAPDQLRARVAALAAPAPRRARHRTRWTLSLGGVTAALAATAVLLLVGGEQAAAPTVSDAATRVAQVPAPPGSPPDRRVAGVLAGSVGGVAYPDWRYAAGWRAVRARQDDLGGHAITTVFYENARGQRVGYAIAAGAPLPVRGGRTVERQGIHLRILRSGGMTIVTWLRRGHTCILAGRGVAASALTALASR